MNPQNQLRVIGKAIFAISGDKAGFTYQATVVSHEGKLWLVATWAELHATAERIPEWLLPLDAIGLGHLTPAPLMTLGTLVPKELAGPHAELPAMQRAGAVLNPALLHIPGPGSIQ